ncbi:pentapeptide repeat-containing protein [Saccharothrix saharensis]|uniref:pentapeptide repeat-containing protein n=1 Tax=Saccharothrix saharensis TaxID=571190 RepID=UPI003680F19D
MSEEPLQVSRAVLGFDRGPRLRRALAAVALVAAVVSLAPRWWAQAVVSGGQWAGRHWPVWVFVLVAVALAAGGRRRGAMALPRRPRTSAMPLLVHVALLLALAAAVAAGVGWALWAVLGRPTGVQERLDAVKVVLTVVGGVGAVVALTVAYRRQRLDEVDSHREDAKVLLDRYAKAAELLGAPDASVRIAGVYAFAALANDAPEARQGCIDVLCAYLRQPYGTAGVAAEGTAHVAAGGTADRTQPDPGQERHVRLTVIRLIRDNLHLPTEDPRTWRGHDFDFTGAVFDGGDFTGATFTDAGRVTFAEATITGRLSFAAATFAGGVVSFDRARFAGGSVSFEGARFVGGVVDLSGIDEGSTVELWPAGVQVPRGLRLPAASGEVTADGR